MLPSPKMVRAICEMTVSSCDGMAPMWRERKVMPRNNVTRMVLMATSVTAALRDFGSLKAVMPLEMASMPVRAVEPLLNARRIRKRVMGAAVSCSISTPVTTPSVPVAQR